MNDSPTSVVGRLRQWDERRPSLPGEHWMAAAAGLYLLLRPSRSVPLRLASVAGGALLITRALTGRDGAIAAAKRFAQGESGADDYIDVAAPWPHAQRVRVMAPRRARPGTETAPREDERAPVDAPG